MEKRTHQNERNMKKIALMMMTLLCLSAAGAQTKQEMKAARKEANEAARQLKKEGYKPLELGKMEKRLESYFLKVNSGCAQIIGTADKCMTTNLAQVTALTNAANTYALLAGGFVRGRIISSTSNISEQQLDNILSNFERLVAKEIRGELIPCITVVRNQKGLVKARVYCIVDQDTATRLRQRALQAALEEQALAEQYGSQVSKWINEGFESNDE